MNTAELIPAFEDATAAAERIAHIRHVAGDRAADFEVRAREAALWELRTREEMIAAVNRLATAIERVTR